MRERLLANAHAEFERLMREEPTDAWPCEPRGLARHDVPAHKHMLAGQYGLLKPAAAREDELGTIHRCIRK